MLPHHPPLCFFLPPLRLPYQPTAKLKKKTLNLAAKLKFVSFLGHFSHNGDIYILGKLGGFWKINAISTEFGDFRTHIAIYWKTNQHAKEDYNFYSIFRFVCFFFFWVFFP
jgi:hypothetical protein